MTMKQHCQVNFPATANDRKCFDWNQKSQANRLLKNDSGLKTTSDESRSLDTSQLARLWRDGVLLPSIT